MFERAREFHFHSSHLQLMTLTRIIAHSQEYTRILRKLKLLRARTQIRSSWMRLLSVTSCSPSSVRYSSERCVMVGDPKQLSSVTFSNLVHLVQDTIVHSLNVFNVVSRLIFWIRNTEVVLKLQISLVIILWMSRIHRSCETITRYFLQFTLFEAVHDVQSRELGGKYGSR